MQMYKTGKVYTRKMSQDSHRDGRKRSYNQMTSYWKANLQHADINNSRVIKTDEASVKVPLFRLTCCSIWMGQDSKIHIGGV